MIYLVLAVSAFVVFGLVLAVTSWYEQADARVQASDGPKATPPLGAPVAPVHNFAA